MDDADAGRLVLRQAHARRPVTILVFLVRVKVMVDRGVRLEFAVGDDSLLQRQFALLCLLDLELVQVDLISLLAEVHVH